MSDLDKAIKARSAKSPGFQTMVDKELAELHLGLTIKELRQKSGMTQEDLARRLRTTKSAVSRLENSSGGARLETLGKIAKAFGKESVVKPLQSFRERLAVRGSGILRAGDPRVSPGA